MFDCNNLLHPFQSDPGTSQHQRIIDQLLSNTAKIDARSLADLLNFFSRLSNGINFYDKELNVSTWQPFFSKSLPFLLASLSRYDDGDTRDKFELYKKLFSKETSIQGLQLMLSFILYNTFSKINSWYEEVKGTNLPIEGNIEELIRTRLAANLKTFIVYANTASKWFCTKKFDFTKYLDTPDSDVWDLEIRDLYAIDINFPRKAIGRCELLRILYKDVSELLPTLLEGLKQVVTSAEASIKDSLVPQAKELQENHPPHLALVFAFISLFQKLQGELNKKTKEHLHFFYTEVLKIKPAPARADKAHVVFELQKLLEDQYEKYKVDAGTQLLAGRDDKNFDILFGTGEEIIVNETQVADLRTLFLNYEHVVEGNYLEGVYIAPNVTKADGAEKDFKDGDPRNWFTLGRDNSKYTEPRKKIPKKHPQARMGFVLASPVLYLAGGERTVTVTLNCHLNDSLCNELEALCKAANGPNCPAYNDFYSANHFYSNRVRGFLFQNTGTGDVPTSYIVINEALLEQAAAGGMTQLYIDEIRNFFLKKPDGNECTGENLYYQFRQVEHDFWTVFRDDPAHIQRQSEIFMLPEVFKEHYPIKVWFSGAEEWIVPEFTNLSLSTLNANGDFTIEMILTVPAGKPAVTFYDKIALKEDLGSELPMMRVELNDSLKVEYFIDEAIVPECCLEKTIDASSHFVSLYHFFRNVTVKNSSKIDVKVCGLKNFIVQNDENVMDVNGIIYPFGTRPKVSANFYVSSKEIFCKNWSEFDLNFNWKDKPASMKVYYHGYEDKLTGITSDHLADNRFVFQYSFLDKGIWHPKPTPAFPNPPAPPASADPGAAPFHALFVSDGNPLCPSVNIVFNQRYKFTRANSGLDVHRRTEKNCFTPEAFQNDSRHGFLRMTLLNQDFQHSRYSFVLTRQMLALGKFPEVYVGPVYDGIDPTGTTILPVLTFDDLFKAIEDSFNLTQEVKNRLFTVINAIRIENGNSGPPDFPLTITQAILDAALGTADAPIPPGTVLPIPPPPPPDLFPASALDSIVFFLNDPILKTVFDKINSIEQIRVVIPLEPYTPQIDGIALDYLASASTPEIDLIHLYPFADTHKIEEIELEPTLFPTFCDEGTLYIGFNGLQPGSNLHVLFQLAEATADSEAGKEIVRWHYLDNNNWRDLRTGFEVLEDNTFDLTTSGIVRFALPENMSTQHSIMPKNIHWIKASLGKNSKTVSETIGIHTQAVSSSFVMNETTDTARLGAPLEPGKIEKLLVAQPNIKGLIQPYESFGGRLPELEGSYHIRVSEQLRHKGRAIQKWDYERLTLEEFPLIYKAKCINHSFHTDANIYWNDVPYAPGYVILAVIPDLRRLKAGNSFEPKVPVSVLNKIDAYLQKRASPFVRLKASNPRYEKIHFCITVRFKLGVDENYYTEKLKSDIREYLAPWAVGKYDKLTFGQCVYRSDIIRFIERTGYVDFIIQLKMRHDNDNGPLTDRQRVCPNSPRSILFAGNIDIIKDDQRCDSWCDFEPEEIQCDQYALVNDYCIPEAIPVPVPAPAPEPTPPPVAPIN